MDTFITPDWPTPKNVRALVTTRHGGVSTAPWTSFNLASHVGDDPAAVLNNRARLRERLPSEPPWLTQTHGTVCVDAATAAAGVAADASFTRQRGVVCAVLTADCLPVLLADAQGTVVGIAHGGWRGLAGGVIECVVRAMGVAPGSLVAYLGPVIGARAYEVGRDVFDAFVGADSDAKAAFASYGAGKFLADLDLLARQRLMRLGVRGIHGGNMCTYSDPERFYSYRRDGATGRMASLVWME